MLTFRIVYLSEFMLFNVKKIVKLKESDVDADVFIISSNLKEIEQLSYDKIKYVITPLYETVETSVM